MQRATQSYRQHVEGNNRNIASPNGSHAQFQYSIHPLGSL